MSGLSPEARAQQARLKERFIRSLPDKRAGLEESWKRVRVSMWNPNSIAELRTLAHRLAGSAGSYGLDELGAAALRLDHALEAAENSGAQNPLIKRLMAELLAALAKAEW